MREINPDRFVLHNSWTCVDNLFPQSAPMATLVVIATREDLDDWIWECTLRFAFGDSAASLELQFDEKGLDELGSKMVKAAAAIRAHKEDQQKS